MKFKIIYILLVINIVSTILSAKNTLVDNFIRNNQIKKQNLKTTVNEVYKSYYKYLTHKYNQKYPDIKDSLYQELLNSPYYNSRKKSWNREIQNKYVLFRMEYEYFKHRYQYSFDKISTTQTYKNILKRLKQQGYTKKQVDKIFMQISKYDFTPLHFYYRPHSIKEQLKLDKVKIENVNFKPINKFYKNNKKYLVATEKKYLVNKEIITAILYKETRLGKIPLNFKPLEVLLVQALFKLTYDFDTKNKRTKSLLRMKKLAKSAKNSLFHTVKYCIDNKIHPDSISSNFVGAIGYPQFMPFNLHLAKDGNNNGKIDLNTTSDAIASIGNFLYTKGWKKRVKLNNINKSYIYKQIRKYNRNKSYIEAVYNIAKKLKKVKSND